MCMTSTSRLFELLAADHRRQVLFLLCATESLEVPEGLFTRSAAQQSGDSQSRPSSVRDSSSTDPSSQQLDMELYHSHLPKLEAEGIIEWDREAGTVSRGRTFQEIEPALRLLAANSVVFPGDLF